MYMENNSQPKRTVKESLLMDIQQNSRSWQPVVRNKWIIKFSIYEVNVLLIVTSIVTGQTFVRYFADEDNACEFLNYILSQDAAQLFV